MTEMPMVAEIDLLQRIKALNHDAIHEVEQFTCDANLSALAREYQVNLLRRDVDIGFNLFTIISERYYQENFHSDILKALIDPKGKHQERDTYLRLFLQFLCSRGVAITLPDYSNAQVVREEGKIDLVIKDDTSQKAICDGGSACKRATN